MCRNDVMNSFLADIQTFWIPLDGERTEGKSYKQLDMSSMRLLLECDVFEIRNEDGRPFTRLDRDFCTTTFVNICYTRTGTSPADHTLSSSIRTRC